MFKLIKKCQKCVNGIGDESEEQNLSYDHIQYTLSVYSVCGVEIQFAFML